MANPENEKRLKTRLLVWVGEKLGSLMLRFFYYTNRWEVEGEKHYKFAAQNGQAVIIAAWHNSFLTVFMNLAKNQFYGMAGNHQPDAEIIARTGKKLGWKLIRGSSTDGGKKAYDDMLEILQKPTIVFAITPDGPQGPAKTPKAGTIRAAQKTGALIIPTSGQSTRRWSFTNWDTFYLTKPFGKTALFFGKPIFFDKNQNFAECQKILKTALDKLEKKVEAHIGME